MGGSYVWSRLYGNYAGLQNSDEIRTPTLGLASRPISSRPAACSAWAATPTDRGISTSRCGTRTASSIRRAVSPPIVRTCVKLYGATMLPFGTEIGVNFYAGSGTPLSTYVNTLNGIEVLVNGRGDMGRTPVLT